MKRIYCVFYKYGNKIQMENTFLEIQDKINPIFWNGYGRLENQNFESFEAFIKFLKDNNIRECHFNYDNHI